MNIFVTSKSPVKSAKYLAQDMVRLNKQIVECSQMLANFIIDFVEKNKLSKKFIPKKVNGEYYKKSHFNHHVSKWVRANDRNYLWTYLFFEALGKQYELKKRKRHNCLKNCGLFWGALCWLPDVKKRDKFVNCTPYKDLPVFEAYKKHLADKWKNKA